MAPRRSDRDRNRQVGRLLLTLIGWAAVALILGPRQPVGEAIAPARMLVQQTGPKVQGHHLVARDRQQRDGADGVGAIAAVGGVGRWGSDPSPPAQAIATEATAVAADSTPQVLLNKTAGNEFRDQVAQQFIDAGYGVRTEVPQ